MNSTPQPQKPEIEVWSPTTNKVVQFRKHLSKRHSLQIIVRNAFYAACARILFGVVKIIARSGFSNSFFRRALSELLSLNPVKWAILTGGFSSFRLCMQIIAGLGERVHMREEVAAVVSGCICSLPTLVMDKSTRTELSLYAFVRFVHSFCLRFMKPRVPNVLSQFKHYDVLLMCLSACQIGYASTFAPYTLPTSYRRFLINASMHDERFVRGHTSFMRGHTAPELVELCLERDLPLITDFSKRSVDMVCSYSHKGMTCNEWAVRCAWNNIVKIGIPLYGPLRVLMTLIFDRRRLMKQPIPTIVRGVRSVLASSLFLGLYVGCIIRPLCFSLHRRLRTGAIPGLLCFAAGLATLIEPKGRRMDLALYCSTFAIRSFVLAQNRLGNLPYPKQWFMFLVYMLSMSFLLYEYEEEPKMLHPRVYSIFRFVLGETPPRQTLPSPVKSLSDENEKSLSESLS